MDDFERQMQQILKQEANRIGKRAKEILEDCIREYLYDRDEPNTYIRTMQLLNSVNVSIEGYSVVVYIDNSQLDYYSAVDGRDVSEAVPWFLTQGHDDKSPIDNWYHHYPRSNYLEMALDRIQNELGVQCEIINNAPQQV